MMLEIVNPEKENTAHCLTVMVGIISHNLMDTLIKYIPVRDQSKVV